MPRWVDLCLVAVVFVTTCGLARADVDFDRLQLRLNGSASVVGAAVDQSNLDGLDEAVFAIDASLLGSAVLPLEGGGEIGGRVAFGVDYASNFDSMVNDAGSTNLLDELWLYGEFNFGRLQAGLVDGVADIMGLGVPQVSRAIRVDNPEIFLLGFPCNPGNCSSDPQAPGSLFSPNGMQLRTDIHSSDDFIKLIYVTPVFNGLRFGVSYTPDGTRDPGQLFGDDEFNEHGNIWDFGVNYVTTVGVVDLGLSAGYVTSENVNNTAPWLFDDAEDYGAAVRLGYREWTFGTAYRRTNVAGGGPIVQGVVSNVFDDTFTDIWSVGLTYERGPWMFGATYIAADEELFFSATNQEGEGVQLAAGYTIGENVRVTGGYQHFDFQGPIDDCFNFGGGSCDTLDGDVGYLETTFSF
jgi:outer membrane protein OmpU